MPPGARSRRPRSRGCRCSRPRCPGGFRGAGRDRRSSGRSRARPVRLRGRDNRVRSGLSSGPLRERQGRWRRKRGRRRVGKLCSRVGRLCSRVGKLCSSVCGSGDRRRRNRSARGWRPGFDRNRGRDRCRPRRKQGLWVDVALILVCVSHAELDVGTANLSIAARPNRPDRIPLGHRGSFGHGDGTELCERHRPSVRGEDRDRLAAPRNRAGERNDATGRREDRFALGASHVDPTVLARAVWMVRIEGERQQDRAAGRPGPRPCGTGHSKRGNDHEQDSAHLNPLVGTRARRSSNVPLSI
jgi:hypothetical protein